MGAVLALTESLGLGFLGVDHYIMAKEATYQGEFQVAEQHTTFGTMKLVLLLGAIVVYYTLRNLIKAPNRDPIYVFPLLIFICWLVWSLHDFLWVIMGSLLEYK